MKQGKATGRRKKFDVVLSSRTAQVAVMTLKPGEASDQQPHNEHPESEQWLYVISGSGEAISRRGKTQRTIKLRRGTLVLVEKRELHQIRCTGRIPLVTLNFYAPAAYTATGKPRSGGG